LTVWGMNQVIQNPVVIPAIVILAVAIALYGRKHRRNRRKWLRPPRDQP
jgi:hypothetical protein